MSLSPLTNRRLAGDNESRDFVQGDCSTALLRQALETSQGRISCMATGIFHGYERLLIHREIE